MQQQNRLSPTARGPERPAGGSRGPPATLRRTVATLLLATFAPSTAALAETPSVRVGALDLKPYLLVQQDEGGTFDQSRDGGQGTGGDTRRARVGAEATLAERVEVDVIYDFGAAPGGGSRFFEAQAAYSLAPFVVRAGILKPAFTLEYAQSAADILFLERASIVNVVGGLVAGAGRTGAQIQAGGRRWFATALLTGGTSGPGAQSDQRAVLGRVAGLAIRTDSVSLHLGASGAWLYQVPRDGDGRQALGFSDQPELRVDNVDASLSTGPLPANGARLGGLEAGLGWNRLWLQAEWYGLHVDRSRRDGGGLFFSGEYVQAAYTVLGRPRRWKPGVAAWGSPSPAGGFDPLAGRWGAVEVAARLSAADLGDADVRGGRQTVWTAGLSWYPADPLRFTLQFEHADVTATATPRRLDALALRGQIRF